MLPLSRLVLLLACLCVTASSAAPASAGRMLVHPVHATITDLTYDPAGGSVDLLIRVFADDLAEMLVNAHGAAINDQGVIDYLSDRVVLYGSDRKQVVLRWGGISRQEDLVLIRLGGHSGVGVAGGAVRVEIGFELFADQVNIVKVRYGSDEHTLLFRRGNGLQRIP